MYGHDFAGVAPFFGIEDATNVAHGSQCIGVENACHIAKLVDPHAMLSGDRAAGSNTDVHDVGTSLFHPLTGIRLGPVVVDIGVEVAVTRMKDVADRQAMLLADLIDPLEHVWQCGPWDHRILHYEIGTDPPQGTKSFLPTLPQPGTLRGIVGHLHGSSAGLT